MNDRRLLKKQNKWEFEGKHDTGRFCEQCGSMLQDSIINFGESLDRETFERAQSNAERADGNFVYEKIEKKKVQKKNSFNLIQFNSIRFNSILFLQ